MGEIKIVHSAHVGAEGNQYGAGRLPFVSVHVFTETGEPGRVHLTVFEGCDAGDRAAGVVATVEQIEALIAHLETGLREIALANEAHARRTQPHAA